MPEIGVATLSIEEDRPGRAVACIDQGNGIPTSRLDLSFRQTGTAFDAVSVGPAFVFNYDRDVLVPIDEHPDSGKFTYSKTITVSGSISGKTISGMWKGDSGAEGVFELANDLGRESAPDHTFTWDEFKVFCGDVLPRCGDS